MESQISEFISNDIFIPDSITQDKFVQFAADNLDIIEETLDGRDIYISCYS